MKRHHPATTADRKRHIPDVTKSYLMVNDGLLRWMLPYLSVW